MPRFDPSTSMSQGVRRTIPLKIMSPKINWISAPLCISDWFSENTGFYRTGSGSASDVSKTEALKLFSTLTYYLSVANKQVYIIVYNLHFQTLILPLIVIIQYNLHEDSNNSQCAAQSSDLIVQSVCNDMKKENKLRQMKSRRTVAMPRCFKRPI